MIIDNGDQRRLIIAGAYAGPAGISRDRIAFTPPGPLTLPPVVSATLDDEIVILSKVEPAENGRTWTAFFERISGE